MMITARSPTRSGATAGGALREPRVGERPAMVRWKARPTANRGSTIGAAWSGPPRGDVCPPGSRADHGTNFVGAPWPARADQPPMILDNRPLVNTPSVTYTVPPFTTTPPGWDSWPLASSVRHSWCLLFVTFSSTAAGNGLPELGSRAGSNASTPALASSYT